jgi:hypothetical protein
MMTPSHLLVTVGTLALAGIFAGTAGCSKKAPAEPIQAEAGVAAAISAQAAPSASGTPGEAGAPRPDDTLFGVIADEGAHRPIIAPNADAVFAALAKAGTTITDLKPSLGRTYKAAYCTGGPTSDEALAVIVCEYPSDTAAAAGGDEAKRAFPTMVNRKVWTHKSTILIGVNRKGDAATDARVSKLAAVYMTL